MICGGQQTVSRHPLFDFLIKKKNQKMSFNDHIKGHILTFFDGDGKPSLMYYLPETKDLVSMSAS